MKKNAPQKTKYRNKKRTELSAALLEEIRASFNQGRRIILRGRRGAEVRAVKAALPGVEVVVLDLAHVRTERELERAAGAVLNSTPNLRDFLGALDTAAKARPMVLVVLNLGGCSGSADEAGVVGRLRGEIQGVHTMGVIYSASDDRFLARHLASPFGSFFKQAVIIDL